MGLEKRTVKIIGAIIVALLIIGGILGLVLGLLLTQRYVQLEVWPKGDSYYSSYWDQPLIQYRAGDPGSWTYWVQQLNNFLREYETSVPEDPPRAPCSTQTKTRDQFMAIMRSDQCELGMRMWQPCTADHLYGYPDGRPCVFLRLSHIHYWVPEPYNVSMPLPLPMDMPEIIKLAMHQHPAHIYGDYIWVSCDGEHHADRENIGPIQYIPGNVPPGFPTSRLHTADRIPRSAQSLPDQIPGPLVGIFFENPRRGVLINVECRVWSRDLSYYYEGSTRVGHARFELFIE